MVRILWIPSAQPGSLFPAMPIALALVERGHQLTVLCAARSQAAFDSLGLEVRPARQLGALAAPSTEDGRAGKLAWHARLCPRPLRGHPRRALRRGVRRRMVDPLEPGADFAAEATAVPSFTYVHGRPDEAGADVPFRFHFWEGARGAAAAFVDRWNEQRALVGSELDVDRPPVRSPRSGRPRARDSPSRRAERRTTSTVEAGGRSVDAERVRSRQERQHKRRLSREKSEAL
jgi:hypothetical protein